MSPNGGRILDDPGGPFPTPTSNNSRKFKRALVIGIALWVFMMISFLALAIAIDWH